MFEPPTLILSLRLPFQLLYLNPEHDILHIQTFHPAKHTLVAFLHGLKAYEPRDIRLLRLAVESNTVSTVREALLGSTARASAELSTPTSASLISTLAQLRDIIYMMQGRIGRAIIGPLIDLPEAGVRFSHSMPIKSPIPSFHLTFDPRPKEQVEADLQYVLAWKGLRGIRWQMQEIFQELAIWPMKPAVSACCLRLNCTTLSRQSSMRRLQKIFERGARELAAGVGSAKTVD